MIAFTLNNNPPTTQESLDSFDIRNYIDQLEPSPKREKDKYICPVCNGHNLSIPQNGKGYKCFNGCECKDIREVLSPWEEKIKQNNKLQPSKKVFKSSKKKLPNAAPIPEGGKLIYIENPDFEYPKVQQPSYLPDGIPANSTATVYKYSEFQFVTRYQWEDKTKEKGYDKSFRQSHISGTKTLYNKGSDNWKAYRLDENLENARKIVDANESNIPAFIWQEGEKDVEILRQNNLASLTLQGSNWTDVAINRELFTIAENFDESIQVFIADCDQAGIKKAVIFSKECAALGLPCIVLSAANFIDNPPEKADIEQILEHMSTQEFIKKLEAEIHKAVTPYQSQQTFKIDKNEEGLNFLQIAARDLYSDKNWISIDGKLHYHTVTYYKSVEDCDELSRIAKYCDSYIVYEEKNGIVTPSYPYAKPSKVKEILEWVKSKCGIDPRLVNSQGTNFTNYVVSITWEDDKPKIILQEHSPNHYFTYEPLVEYNPNASTADCDRLLECLDPKQREVLMRNLAASLSLNEVRKRRSREVKIIFACGNGNNGKDSIRSVVSAIYGKHGITSISLADFAHYDEGRKFALAPLMNSRINWASENPQTSRIDKIQSLKIFATGELLHAERKGKDHIEFPAEAIGIFHLNDIPSLQGTQEAIKSRIAILTFNKAYKNENELDVNNPNELKADPRFKYDEEFIRTKVAPAFFNKMVEALGKLVDEGIDYSCTEDALKAVQIENNHLFQFINDVGIGYVKDSSMSASQIWELLKPWYINNGTLEINEYGKYEWNEQVKPSDKNVKAINQVLKRVAPLFPKAKLTSKYDVKTKNTIQLISGIGIIDNTRTIIDNSRSNAVSIPVPENLTQQELRTTRTNFEDFEENKNEKNSSTTHSDNIFINVKEVEAPQIGTGDTESSPSKNSRYGSETATDTGKVPTGTAEEAKGADPITEPESEGTEQVLSQFKIGDRVRYSGQDNISRQHYAGKLLIVTHLQYGKVTCRLPDGNYTTWIYPNELKKIN